MKTLKLTVLTLLGILLLGCFIGLIEWCNSPTFHKPYAEINYWNSTLNVFYVMLPVVVPIVGVIFIIDKFIKTYND